MKRIVAFAGALALLPGLAAACDNCYGDPGNPLVKGAANGVWVMVGIVAAVLAGIAWITLRIAARIRAGSSFAG